MFPSPRFCNPKIEACCCSFLWIGDANISMKNPVAWKKICKLKSQEGLNIFDLDLWNQVYILKLL